MVIVVNYNKLNIIGFVNLSYPQHLVLLLHVVLARGPSGQWWQCSKENLQENRKKTFQL